MGLFGFGGISHKGEENAIRASMNRIGAREGTHMENCERCNNYVGPKEAGSKYFGGCRKYQIKVFSSHVCGDFHR